MKEIFSRIPETNYSNQNEKKLLQKELNLYQKMKSMERVPILEYGQSDLAQVVSAFTQEIDKHFERNSFVGKNFIFFLEGLPASGKDYTADNYIKPTIETHLNRLRLKYPNIPQLQEFSWDKTQEELRQLGKFTTPADQPSQPEELRLTRDKMSTDLAHIILKKQETACNIVLVKLLSGTALKHENNWFYNPNKIYGDYIPDYLVNRTHMFFEIPKDSTVISRVALEAGPWSLIWQYYRWIILQTKTKVEADKINKLYHIPSFSSEDEWSQFIQRGGGAPKTIGEAIRVATLSNYKLKQIGKKLPSNIPNEIFSDIKTVATLLGVETDDVKQISLTLLNHSLVHENNIKKTQIPQHLSAIIYNNFRINLAEIEKVNLWAILKDLIIDEKGLSPESDNSTS